VLVEVAVDRGQPSEQVVVVHDRNLADHEHTRTGQRMVSVGADMMTR